MKNLSLQFRMMFFSTVMVIFVVSTISTILLYFHHKAVWEEFDLRVESLSGALSKELELVVLLEDRAGIERLLNGALKLPDVLSVSVWDKKDKLLLQKGDASFVTVEDRKIVEYDVELESTRITAEMMEPMASGKTEKIGRLVAVFSAAKLKTRFMKMIYSILIVTLVVIFLRLLADYLFTKGVTKPIEKLVHGAESVANGDLTQRIDMEEGSEIGKLALAFNKMVTSLAEREAELQASHRDLQRSFHELATTNEELLFAKKNAEAASETKSEFLANMSHELRTPLTAIIGFTQLLLGGAALKPEQMDYLNRVNGAGRNLLKLVNEMLDLIKIEKDELKLEITGFHLTAILESNLRPLAFKAHRKGLEFLVYISPDTPVALEGDPGRLVQVLVNLVDNAIKFTKTGEVTVLVTLEGQSQNSARILFSVRDTGIGISKAHQEIVFESFRQADGSSTRKYGGIGLGATISRQLVELMGGRIWVESEEGIGSTFNFNVQFKIPAGKEDETAGRIPKPLPRDFRVLVVDDNDSSRRILHRMLDFWNLKAAMCASGQEAIDMIIEAQAKKAPFDVCLLDLQMPATGGAETVERLKENRGAFPLPEFIMLGQEEVTSKIKEIMGPDIKFLSKPLFQPELYRALLETVEGKKGLLAIDNCPSTIDNGQSAAAVPIKSPFVSLKDAGYAGSRKILIVEDNSSNMELVKCALELKGFRVELAENGKVALDIYEEKGCDLILMDIQMPVMDGFEATAAIRKKEKGATRRIPIIALTAHAMKGDREKCLKAGMDGYVSKPVDLRELIDTVNRHL